MAKKTEAEAETIEPISPRLERRFKLVAIEEKDRNEFIESWYAGNTKIPVDAEFSGEFRSDERGCYYLKFAHSSFDIVKLGSLIPEITGA